MIITSDNSATDMLLARVGGLDALNEWLREKGFTETRMVQSTADFFRQPLVVADPLYRSLSTEQVFAYWTAPYEINAARSRRRAAMGAELQKALPLGPQIEKVAKLWHQSAVLARQHDAAGHGSHARRHSAVQRWCNACGGIEGRMRRHAAHVQGAAIGRASLAALPVGAGGPQDR